MKNKLLLSIHNGIKVKINRFIKLKISYILIRLIIKLVLNLNINEFKNVNNTNKNMKTILDFFVFKLIIYVKLIFVEVKKKDLFNILSTRNWLLLKW